MYKGIEWTEVPTRRDIRESLPNFPMYQDGVSGVPLFPQFWCFPRALVRIYTHPLLSHPRTLPFYFLFHRFYPANVPRVRAHVLYTISSGFSLCIIHIYRCAPIYRAATLWKRSATIASSAGEKSALFVTVCTLPLYVLACVTFKTHDV